MSGAIAELLDTGCIRAVLEHSLVCSPLSVVESSAGKKRLVINLRHLNRFFFLWKQKLKYEDLRIAKMLFNRYRTTVTAFVKARAKLIADDGHERCDN